ncbi:MULTISPECIES: hypothetical protein [unclassified Acinetobacter]|uniref:hypothetical protein n=1 Tax=unclassified Acinetobacter TaxID=196816 RepID=UPI00190CFDB3|nr:MULTISPECIES: hypothetical protein [unclassified Acinetobacter]MBK0065185.1 hypothetical protein [Acinetobacter sp. S55]MBK0068442.1 hypothetical protein [Acinetobacter sp. S54]
MQLIEIEPHFWELYQQDKQFFLSIAIDLSSVVSCWDLILTAEEILLYQTDGREAILTLTEQFVVQVYRGDCTGLEQRMASSQQKKMMNNTFKTWQKQNR